MKVIEILEQIENEINDCNQRLEFLHKMRVYLTGSLAAFENIEESSCLPTGVHFYNFEEDKEEKAYIAAEQEGKQLDNELISEWQYIATGVLQCKNCGLRVHGLNNINQCSQCSCEMINSSTIKRAIIKERRKGALLCSVCQYHKDCCDGCDCIECDLYCPKDEEKCACEHIMISGICPNFIPAGE